MKADVAELTGPVAAAMAELEETAQRHGIVLVGMVYPRAAVAELVDEPPNEQCVLFALQPDGPEFAPDVCGKLFGLTGEALMGTAMHLRESEADVQKH